MQNIFLDVTCFFNGDDKDHVTFNFDDLDLRDNGLDILVHKSLLTISKNKIEMHDLLEEIGPEIIRWKSEEEPGTRSRLWYHKNILHVLMRIR